MAVIGNIACAARAFAACCASSSGHDSRAGAGNAGVSASRHSRIRATSIHGGRHGTAGIISILAADRCRRREGRVNAGPSLEAGTVFHPEPEQADGAAARLSASADVRLGRLPRRRRPAVIALGAALVGAGVLASAALSQRPPAPSPGPMVIGLVAATSLQPGTLLSPSELTTRLLPAPGQDLVPLAVRPSTLPADGLVPGDRVLVVATPGDQGESGSGAAAEISGPVPGTVEAVSSVPDQDGYDVVDVLVAADAAAALARQASTGQFALIVTSREAP